MMCGAPLCPLPSRCPAPAPLLTGAEAHSRDAGAVTQRKGGHVHLVVERLLCRSGGCGAGRQLAGFGRRHGAGIGGGLGLAPGKAQHWALRAAQPGHLILGGPGGGRRARQGCWVAGTSDGGGDRGAGRSLQAGPGCTAGYLYAGTRRRSQKSGARAESNIFASGAAVLTSHSVARAAQQSVALLQALSCSRTRASSCPGREELSAAAVANATMAADNPWANDNPFAGNNVSLVQRQRRAAHALLHCGAPARPCRPAAALHAGAGRWQAAQTPPPPWRLSGGPPDARRHLLPPPPGCHCLIGCQPVACHTGRLNSNLPTFPAAGQWHRAGGGRCVGQQRRRVGRRCVLGAGGSRGAHSQQRRRQGQQQAGSGPEPARGAWKGCCCCPVLGRECTAALCPSFLWDNRSLLPA